MIKKKSVSPLISIILIIVICFILILAYSGWLKDYVKNTTDNEEIKVENYLDCQNLKFIVNSCRLSYNNDTNLLENVFLVLNNQSNIDLKGISLTLFGVDDSNKISTFGSISGTITKGLQKTYNLNEDYTIIDGSEITEYKEITGITILSAVCPEKIIYIEDCKSYNDYCDSPSAPLISVTGGSYSESITVSLSSDCPESSEYTIYYTLDESTPTNRSLEYITPIVIETSLTLKAILYSSNSNNNIVKSSVSEEEYIITE
jgi:hypothetical protein